LEESSTETELFGGEEDKDLHETPIDEEIRDFEQFEDVSIKQRLNFDSIEERQKSKYC
jgi:hypothetical protein